MRGAHCAILSSLCIPWDHPHVCGEHEQLADRVMRGEGSSPRMRGARVGNRWYRAPRGIIPAYAGSTVALQMFKGGTEDHPRVCGEHTWTTSSNGCYMGSSPRMRGARIGIHETVVIGRIIPAYAGST